MKTLKKLIGITLMAGLLSTNASAHRLPDVCENTKRYQDDAFIIQAPAAVGGCIGNIIGLPIGAIAGFSDPPAGPVLGAYFVGLGLNVVGNVIFGAPTKVLKTVLWDWPKNID